MGRSSPRGAERRKPLQKWSRGDSNPRASAGNAEESGGSDMRAAPGAGQRDWERWIEDCPGSIVEGLSRLAAHLSDASEDAQ